VLLLDLPTLPSDDGDVLLRVAVFSDPWPGPVAIWRSFDGASYEQTALALAPSIVGTTLDDLPAGPTSRWDRASHIRVQLAGGALAAASDLRVLGGANAAAVQRPDSAWEVLQFANATLVDERTYELSRFLRGQAGSEWAIAAPLPAGAPFVLLDEHVVPVATGLDLMERPMQVRIVAAGRDHGDPAAVALTATPRATALKPLAPVHLRARRSGAGITFTFVRRTRRDGDGWGVEVPLGEEREAYELDVLAGSTVKRTLASEAPLILYTAGDEIADFGTAQTSLSVRLAQMSATVGRGIVTTATLNL
jgi:hypothetical protein